MEGHTIEMGNRWGGGRQIGEGKGRGGQFTSNLGPEWTGVALHAKEGFQVSKRDSGDRGGFARQRGNYQGELSGGFVKGFVPCALMYCQSCLNHATVCMWLIKELCLGYK